jgi:hypothetical protein
VLLYINRNEPEMDYSWYEKERSSLAAAIDNAAFLRDTYANDEAAARVLDKALARKDAVNRSSARGRLPSGPSLQWPWATQNACAPSSSISNGYHYRGRTALGCATN